MKKKNIETKTGDSKYNLLNIHNLYDAPQIIFITYYKKKKHNVFEQVHNILC